MLARMAAVITAGLTGLAGSAAMACEPGGCVYTPASPAYAVAPRFESRDTQLSEMDVYRQGRPWTGLPTPAYRAQGRFRDGGFEARRYEDERTGEHRPPDRYGSRDEDGRYDGRDRRDSEARHDRDGGQADMESYDHRLGGQGYAGRAWGYSHGEAHATGYERRAHGSEFAGSLHCNVCAAPPPPVAPPPIRYEPRSFEAEGAEAPEVSESFFYGGLSGGAGPGVEVGGPGGFGYGNGGASGFGAAQAWGEGMANAYASAHASASAFAFASGGVHGCSSCWVHPKPPPHKPGCGCKHR